MRIGIDIPEDSEDFKLHRIFENLFYGTSVPVHVQHPGVDL